jgi:hypothetical protein
MVENNSQEFLEFNCGGGSILCENSIFHKNTYFWQVPAHSGPNILGPIPKFKIPLPKRFSPGPKDSKKVCHTLGRQKLREEIYFLETCYFWPSAVSLRPADLKPLPKNYLHGVGKVLKILSRSFHSIKSYSTFYEGRTDRQIDTCPPIHIWAGEIV